jgi:C-terminal processing protease CtpA/Prc
MPGDVELTTGGSHADEVPENAVTFMEERGAIYVSLDAMGDTQSKTIRALTQDVFDALENADAERLVIDLRRNGGGNNTTVEALRHRIHVRSAG